MIRLGENKKGPWGFDIIDPDTGKKLASSNQHLTKKSALNTIARIADLIEDLSDEDDKHILVEVDIDGEKDHAFRENRDGK